MSPGRLVLILGGVAGILMVTVIVTTARAQGGDIVADPDRKAIDSTLRMLQGRLATLRHDPTVKPDHWADAQVFVKAVVWALDLEPSLDDKPDVLCRRRCGGLRSGSTPSRPVGSPGPPVAGGWSAGSSPASMARSSLTAWLFPPATTRKRRFVSTSCCMAVSVRSGWASFSSPVLFDEGDEGGQPRRPSNYIEVHPLGRLGENAYRFEGETDVEEAIESVCRNYRVDRRRIVLRGSSLGGVGTWQLGLKRPDRYAALGPIAGPVDTIEFASSPWPHFVRLEPLAPWQKTMLHLVDAIDYTANAGMVPVVALMGDKDPYFSSHLLIEKAFKKEGIPFVGLVDRGAGHGVSASLPGTNAPARGACRQGYRSCAQAHSVRHMDTEVQSLSLDRNPRPQETLQPCRDRCANA